LLSLAKWINALAQGFLPGFFQVHGDLGEEGAKNGSGKCLWQLIGALQSCIRFTRHPEITNFLAARGTRNHPAPAEVLAFQNSNKCQGTAG
jgi:hypothetical protein